ncbi:unnamed protein product, partial [Rotaria magnacalcarata]
MNSTIITTTIYSYEIANYSIVAPISITLAILALISSILIVVTLVFHRRMHTVSHLLIGNTCVWTIFSCAIQVNNFIYLLFIEWDSSNISCRWRGYFAYMTLSGVTYSYIVQAISRLFFIVLATKYRWIVSFKIHFILIGIQWIVVTVVALPAIVTTDIFFRPLSLCWVPRINMVHVYYSVLAYYCLPTVLIFVIYAYVYRRVRLSSAQVSERTGGRQQQNRDLKIFRNLIVLFTIYLSGGTPATIYIFSGINIIYSFGVIFVPFSIFIEKLGTFFLDRELFNVTKTVIYRKRTRVVSTTTASVLSDKKLSTQKSELFFWSMDVEIIIENDHESLITTTILKSKENKNVEVVPSA